MKRILVRSEQCAGCKTCEFACSMVHSASGDIYMLAMGGELPIRKARVEVGSTQTAGLPDRCERCLDRSCIDACAVDALRFDDASGYLVRDNARCIFCWMCASACPNEAITPVEPQDLPGRCDQCLAEGDNPACVAACPEKALKFVIVEAIPAT